MSTTDGEMKSSVEKQFLETEIGKIAVFTKKAEGTEIPIIFLHGVYFDHHLWDDQVNAINDRTVIVIDMPLHGESRDLKKSDWSLNDCAEMLLEILDRLQIAQVIAVGHSWGSMTILRAAHKQPRRFSAIGLCNMPFLPASEKQRFVFGLQHLMLAFRNFYMKKAAQSLFGKDSLAKNPGLFENLARPMRLLSNNEIEYVDKAVILEAEDATSIIANLEVKTIAVKGREDYVPTPTGIEMVLVEGGHISPLESPEQIRSLVDRLCKG